MTPEEIQEYLNNVFSQLVQIPNDMREFTLSMRSLFCEHAVGTSSDTAQRFRKLRDDARNNAVVYIKCVLPVAKQCVSGIKNYFEYYHDLAMDEWWEGLEDIIEETQAHKETCSVLVAIHDDITANLNKQEDTAKSLIDELTQLSMKYEKEAKEIEENLHAIADDSKEADGFVLVEHKASSSTEEESMPVEPIAKQKKAEIEEAAEKESMLVEVIAKKKEAEIQKAAAAVVRGKLIPALSKFITGIKEIAGTIDVIEKELAPFCSKEDSSKEAEKRIQLHYNAMKSKAGQIMGGCNGFFAVLPSIRSDMDAIPTEGTDQNYVDRWMENQKKIIMAKCSHDGLVKKIMKAIGGN